MMDIRTAVQESEDDMLAVSDYATALLSLLDGRGELSIEERRAAVRIAYHLQDAGTAIRKHFDSIHAGAFFPAGEEHVA